MTNVLLVEDDHMARQLLEIYIEKSENYTLAGSMESALFAEAFCHANAVDMILMDVRMPVMDGYEATRRIRGIGTEYCLNVPIIAMTANAFENDVQKGKEAGMTDHISKPINIEVFYNVIQKNLV